MPEWIVASETGRLREVLVCPPDHYRWLPTNSIARRTLAGGGEADLQGLQSQHRELVAALEQGGARVHLLPPQPHLPYMAYTRDSVVVTHRGPVLCQLERPQRRGEYAHLLDWHEGQGSRFWRKSSAGTLEGGDVHILRPGLALIGASGGRTDLAGAEQLAGWLRAEGWEVRIETFDEHFLHLDVLFCLAAPGLAAACLDVLDPGFVAWLGAHGISCLNVPYRAAMQLGCNILALGEGRVISAAESRDLNAALRAEGLTVLDPPLSLFTAGGGGPHCLTCPLARDA
ncbi:arginine deiminase family protein [Siccirubricoccus sp. KC 17139]|uniref:arginine deiminase n=1 Tax=Siccirubricoccus soli TaxID=2899147 RepID=A0ABT1D6T2_9PROT|nr:arginine deiminase family protein [Siccirubricoccus soli]MCO6417633.1 arginine deiminase family protein [Siccirubricoccus soli]MCP2683768.1 arginine deiminase family protein [Siccirubricoccus soli]